MQKNHKKDPSRTQIAQKHSRNPSAQRQRDSHPRLTICCSPPLPVRKTNHYLSNPNSLEKEHRKDKCKEKDKDKENKLKPAKKKLAKGKKQQQQEATRQTIQTIGEEPWKQHLKITFRSKNNTQREITLRNNSLKCIEELAPIDSYSSLITTFPHPGSTPALLSKERVYLIDWLNFISAQLLLRKNTLHLAVAFIDAFLQQKNWPPQKIQSLGAAALLLAVKQEERGYEGEVLVALSSNESGLTKDQILKMESSIVLGLGFKLNFSTLPFWFDYFAQKWDCFCREQIKHDFQLQYSDLAILRSPEGHCYKHYRQGIQLLDSLLMNPQAEKVDFTKLALAVLYIVTRVQTEAILQKDDSSNTYTTFSLGFMRKASPIFKDRHCFNEVFNEFITEVCDFQMSQIINQIHLVGALLEMGFTYEIDSRIYQSSQNYEQFLRFCTYSQHIRNYFLAKA